MKHTIIIPYEVTNELDNLILNLVKMEYVVLLRHIHRAPSGTKSTILEYWTEKFEDKRWPETLETREGVR